MLLYDRLDSPSPPARRLGRTRARPVLDSAHIMRELGVAINALRAAYAASPAGSADEPESQAATGNAPRRRARTQSRTQRATRVPWPAPQGMPAIRLRMQHLRMLVSPSFLRAVRSSDPVLECARALLSDPRRHSLHASLPHRFSFRSMHRQPQPMLEVLLHMMHLQLQPVLKPQRRSELRRSDRNQDRGPGSEFSQPLS